MTDHKRIARMIISSLALLNQSQTDDRKAGVRFSRAKYFKAILSTLPYAIIDGVMVNRDYKPVGMAEYSEFVDYDEWPVRVAGCASARLYDGASAPWQSPGDFHDYMRKLSRILEYFEKGGDLGKAIEGEGTPMPAGSKYTNYQQYITAKLQELDDRSVVHVALHRKSYRVASATAHKVAGRGKIATRLFNAHFMEVARV